MSEDRKSKKKNEKPLFSIDDRDFNVKAWYLEDDEALGIKGDALIELRYNDKLVRELIYPGYKIYNIAAHFSDIVDGEISQNDQQRGYLIAGSDGLGGYVMPRKLA